MRGRPPLTPTFLHPRRWVWQTYLGHRVAGGHRFLASKLGGVCLHRRTMGRTSWRTGTGYCKIWGVQAKGWLGHWLVLLEAKVRQWAKSLGRTYLGLGWGEHPITKFNPVLFVEGGCHKSALGACVLGVRHKTLVYLVHRHRRKLYLGHRAPTGVLRASGTRAWCT